MSRAGCAQSPAVLRGVQLRKAAPRDAPAVVDITNQAYERYVSLLGRKPQAMTADHLTLITEHEVWLLADGDRALAVLELIEEPDCTLIDNGAVRPEAQHRGLGRRMLAWAEAEAVRAGRVRIRLYTNALMADNLRLYARLGYQGTGREAYLGSTPVHMAKGLSASMDSHSTGDAGP